MVPPANFKDQEQLKDWLYMHPAQAQVMVERHRNTRIATARVDINEFVELVGRDEVTGLPMKQAPVHEAYQRLFTKYQRLVLWGHVESGKTSQVIQRVLWELGCNPNLRIVIVSQTQSLAMKLVSSIKSYIENSAALHEVFPNLRPGSKWSDHAITVAGRVGSPKDFSVQAIGVGSSIIGTRIDLAILDDILDWNNTRTQDQRELTGDWHAKTISGRLTEAAREWIIGNAWHPQDFLHITARNPMWHAEIFPVIDPVTHALRWPERWSQVRIDAWTTLNGSSEAARQLYCVARSDEDSRFKQDWIARCLARGEGRSMPYSLQGVPLGYKTYSGVDVSTGESADRSSIVTICLWPGGDRELLCVETGKWSGPEIVKRIVSTHQRYLSIVAVESNAAQKFITQFTGGAAPVKNFLTGRNKTDPAFGVESLAVEMERGQWIIPSSGGRALTMEVQDLIRAMLYYNAGKHTPDELMAMWIAREASMNRVGKVRSGAQRTLRR